MKKILKGFTLAEVLITLAIVGLVSALALPSLNSAVTSAQIGPQVGKVMSTLENGNKAWLTQNNARRFTRECFDDYFVCMNRARIFNGNLTDNNEAFLFSDGIRLNPNGAIARMNDAIVVEVDLNANERPNRPGRDRFVFYIRRNGDVIPYGGREHARILGNNNAIWANNCRNINQFSASNDAFSCTGSIIDNGMQALYLDSGKEADIANARAN